MLSAISRHCFCGASSIIRSTSKIQPQRGLAEEAATSGMLFTFASPTQVTHTNFLNFNLLLFTGRYHS